MVNVIQIFGQPENVEVPGSIAEKLGEHQAGNLRITEEIDPANLRVTLHLGCEHFCKVLPLARTQARMRSGRLVVADPPESPHRSEERRVGKECRSRWSP